MHLCFSSWFAMWAWAARLYSLGHSFSFSLKIWVCLTHQNVVQLNLRGCGGNVLKSVILNDIIIHPLFLNYIAGFIHQFLSQVTVWVWNHLCLRRTKMTKAWMQFSVNRIRFSHWLELWMKIIINIFFFYLSKRMGIVSSWEKCDTKNNQISDLIF